MHHEENCHHRRGKLGHGAGHRADALDARRTASRSGRTAPTSWKSCARGASTKSICPDLSCPPRLKSRAASKKPSPERTIVLGVMPSAHARELYRAMRPHVEPQMPFSSAPPRDSSLHTHARISEVIAEEIGQIDSASRIAVLSGPSFASKSPRRPHRGGSRLRRMRRSPPKSRKNSPARVSASTPTTTSSAPKSPAP